LPVGTLRRPRHFVCHAAVPAGPCRAVRGRRVREHVPRVRHGYDESSPVGHAAALRRGKLHRRVHTKCLGLRSVPSGNWECPCCAHAPRKKCMPQWPPVPKKGDKSGKKPAANYLAEDDSEGDTSGEE